MLLRPPIQQPGARPVVRPAAPREDDSGSALVAVIGLLAVAAVVAAGLVTATVYSAGFTSATRASVQSRAAAEAGIDVGQAALRTCSAATYTNVAGTLPEFTAEVSYRVAASDGWTTGCPTSSATEVRIVSTGRAQSPGAAGQSRGDEARMEAVYRVGSAVTGPSLDRAVFAESRLNFPGSGSRVLDPTGGLSADLYTNGTIDADSVKGTCIDIHLEGDLLLPRSGVVLDTDCHVRGDVLARGTTNAVSNAKVDGTMVSRTGGADFFYTGVEIGGSLLLSGAFTNFQGAKVGGVPCGPGNATPSCPAAQQHVPDAELPVIPEETFPVLDMPDPPVPMKAWGTWVKENATANNAQTWSPPYSSTAESPACWLSMKDYSVNGPLRTHGDEVIDARACPQIKTDDGVFEIVAGGDLTLYVRSIVAANGLVVRRAAGVTDTVDVRIIVPDSARGATRETLNLDFAANGLVTDTGVQSLLYTPDTVHLRGSDAGLPFRGQVYGHTVTLVAGAYLEFVPVGEPATGGGGGPAEPSFQLVSKRDL